MAYCAGAVADGRSLMTLVDEINLLDLEMFERGEAHAAFRVLRNESPVHWHPGTRQVNGFWSILKYADVLPVAEILEHLRK